MLLHLPDSGYHQEKQRLLPPMSEILQVLTILQFEKRTVSELFTASPSDTRDSDSCNQLPLFDL